MTQAASDLTKFRWSPQPQAAALVQELLDEFLRRCPDTAHFAQRLHIETGTRLVDWLAQIAVVGPDNSLLRDRLLGAGFETDRRRFVYRHPAGLFPLVCVEDNRELSYLLMYVKVDSVADFVFANSLSESPLLDTELPGGPLDSMRALMIFRGDRCSMQVVERHGTTMEVLPRKAKREGLLSVAEMFRLRRRRYPEGDTGFVHARRLIDRAVQLIGVDRAADLFFAAEREYWMSRNRAAQIQYARQQKLGLGWANHDHHTYRSSREHFKDLIAVFEKLGLVCRERFYAGREAGWGAQVMEQPNAGIVVFADVDLSPDEVTTDFAHEPLPARKELGTVGLWCKLHGESFLEAGMHHLECQFDFHAAREQLKVQGVNSMKPFTDFEYLKQAFTEGEMWPVDPRRIDALLRDGQITPEQAEKFRREGAIGSHLEILQRDDGYKGFNQTGISEIIRETDPRRTHSTGA